MSRMHNAALLALANLLVAPLTAQDPPVPPGGFTPRTLLNQLIVWSDGYRSMMDLYYPDVAPPATGWPCVLVVHGGGGTRAIAENVQQGNYDASYGYVVAAYDVRGEPVATRLNSGGGDTSEEAKLRDMAEAFAMAATLLPGRVDQRRLAVTGRSMGGAHAYRAAAWSARPMPTGGTFPRISAVVGDWQALLGVEDKYPGGNLAQVKVIEKVYENRAQAPLLWAYALAGDYAQLRADALLNPIQNYLPGILGNDVPVFAFMGHRDSHHMVWSVTRALPALAQTSLPHRVYISTRGHGIPGNDTEWLLHLDLKRRWWDRFLKGERNGVDQEPLAEVGVIPADPTVYTSPTSLWQHELRAQWPPAIAPTTLYATDSGGLTPLAPVAATVTPPMRNRPVSGYGLEQLAQNSHLPVVLANLPLARIDFTTDPLLVERQVLGRPRFSCDVTTSPSRVQLAAVLYDLPPSGPPVFVTMGATGLGAVAAGRHRVEVELDDVAYSVPAGHRIGLALQNLAIRDLPGATEDQLIYVPELNDFDAAVHLGGATPAKLEVPLTAAPISLSPRIAQVSFGSGLSQPMTLDAGTERAGASYYGLLGTSGIGPGFSLPPWIPLNVDAWTLLGPTLIGTPVLQGFTGVLDANGRATLRFQVPAPFRTVVEGLRFSFAALGLQGNDAFASSPAELLVLP